MHDLKWSQTEKRVARAAFDRAVQTELAELIAEFKRKAAAVESADEMWDLEEFLQRARNNFNRKYDYRYSQLIWVFAQLVRQKRVTEEELKGLSAEKLEYIHELVRFGSR